MNKSRRSFLKVAGFSVFALSSGIVAQAAVPGTANAKLAPGSYAKGDAALRARRWAMVIDTRKFAGPRDYEPLMEACRQEHNVPSIPDARNIKWFWLDSYEHTFPDDMNAHLDTKTREAAYPLLCNHCSNPPCVRVCPTQATYKMEDGIVAMDYHRCIGCRFCMAGCPYGARSFNFKDPRGFLPNPVPNPSFPTRMIGVVEKCTFCAERLAMGKMPACVEASEGRILFGDLEDADSKVRRALAANFSIRRKPSLGTQPGVYYLI
ncbi:MAG: 4Fe-4S dicluster domain-containing protein [Desulfovibrio sp.]|jgi:molybdopterin-containing oxidoreductase family iron-sulfur binding subunit|nr:4Fe-4S dicluster domain-containing protein [Desulfovibrio sp.]